MGLNAVRKPAKLRAIERLIGEPCLYAASRYFEDQNDLLVCGANGAAWVVNLRNASAEPYAEPGRVLAPLWNEELGRYAGIATSPA